MICIAYDGALYIEMYREICCVCALWALLYSLTLKYGWHNRISSLIEIIDAKRKSNPFFFT